MLENRDDLAQNIGAEQSEPPAAHIGDDVMLPVKITEGITDENLSDIYSDPYITKIGHDHRPAAPIIHPYVTYLSAWIGDSFAGAFMVMKISSIELEWHSLLKKSSVKYSRILGKMLIDWAFTNHGITRLTAHIISGLESAMNFGLKLGMKYEGCRRHACIQGGIMKDVYILGITREEWSSL